MKGFSDSGIVVASGTGNAIEGCSIYDNNDGIKIEAGSSGTKVNKCNVYHNEEVGVWINGSNDNQIGRNPASIYDNGCCWGVGIVIDDGAANNSIYGNDIYWTGDDDHYQETGILVENAGAGNKISQNKIHGHIGIEGGGFGIYVYDSSPGIRRNEIYDNYCGIYIEDCCETITSDIWNNVIYGTVHNPDYEQYYGIYLFSYMAHSINPFIYHNTIDGGVLDGIFIDGGCGEANPYIYYNIITNFGQYGIENIGGNPTIDYNNVWNNGGGGKEDNYQGLEPGTNDLYGAVPGDGLGKDPLYASHSLQPTSPCIDAIPTDDPPNDPVNIDFPGNSRPKGEGFDIGAYEYVAPVLYNYNLPVPGSTGLVTDYRMFTVPVTFGPGDDLLTIMENQLGPYDPYTWRAFAYGSDYIEIDLPNFPASKPGMAFWIISTGTNAISFEGTPAPDGTYYSIPIEPDWVMFALPWLPGDPNTANIQLDNIAIEGSGPFWITSENNTLTQHFVWEYTGVGPYNGYEKRETGYVLERGTGYWIKNITDPPVTVTMLVPHDNTGNDFSGITVTSFRGAKTSNGDEEEPPPPPGGNSSSSGVKIEGGNDCFIATAAYGSHLHPYVNMLRNFRDTYLLSNAPGKTFVSLYYTYSPPVAELIADNPPLQYLVRLLLFPLIGFSACMLYAGPLFGCLVFLGFIGFILTTGYLILVAKK